MVVFPRSNERGSFEAFIAAPRSPVRSSFHVRMNVAPLKRYCNAPSETKSGGFHVRMNVAPLKPLDATRQDFNDSSFHVRMNVAPLKLAHFLLNSTCFE